MTTQDEITIVERDGDYAVAANGVLQASGTAEEVIAKLMADGLCATRCFVHQQQTVRRSNALFQRLLSDDGNYCSLGSEHRAAINLHLGSVGRR